MATSVMTDLSEVLRSRAKPQQQEARSATGMHRLAEIFARVALGGAFLSSVGDRFGLWGSYGHKNVSWETSGISCSTPGW